MKYFILLYAVLQSAILFSKDLPFHETGGYGTDKIYGLDGEIYRVTNLDNQGEGSLRYGIGLAGPRVIVFEVGGIIDLDQKDLNIKNGQVTVAGQTAPAPGITLIKGSVRISGNEVLIQHLTVRPGDGGYSGPVGWEPDGFSITSRYVVLDHCSVSWAIDEDASVASGGNDVTFYRCIIAEGLSNSIHSKGEHSCGSLVYFYSKNVSIIGCLYVHDFRRNPRLADGARVLFANNVIYNYGIYASHIGANVGAGNPDDPGEGDFIGNAYFKGVDGWDDYMVESHKGDFDKNNAPANGMAYLEDNIGLDRMTGNALIPHDEYLTILSEPTVVPEAFQPNDAYDNIELVLKHAGARPGERSDVDVRVVQSLIDGTGEIIDSQDEVGGYPEYDSTARTMVNIPATGNERRAWLDSISTSLEEAGDLDAASLYAFVDENLSTSARDPESIAFRCYPNPASDHVSLTFRLERPEDMQIFLVDMTGRRVFQTKNRFNAGLHEQCIRFGKNSVPDGLYSLVLTNGTQTFYKKITVRR
jgi:hypothetical protein